VVFIEEYDSAPAREKLATRTVRWACGRSRYGLDSAIARKIGVARHNLRSVTKKSLRALADNRPAPTARAALDRHEHV